MANPLDGSTLASGGGDLKPGETRTILAKHRQTGEVLKTMTLFRTEREYVQDLCDAYNASRSPAAIEHGLRWIVTPSGELRLTDDPDWSRAHARQIESRNETERARHNRLQLEAARAANAYQGEDA